MNNRGFTLLEVVIVLGLIAVILSFTFAISIPTRVNENLILDQNIYKIANDITYAKEYAKANNVTVGFTIDTVNKAYFIKRGNFFLLYEKIPDEYALHSSFNNNEFYITNTGRVNHTGTIRLRNNNGYSATLTVTFVTGRVQVTTND